MLARVVEVTIKGGKKTDVINILQNELVPFLQKQSGFVAYEVGTRETDPNYSLSATYWQSKQDAETCYSSPMYSSILAKLRPLLVSDVKPVFYNVDISTSQQIAHGKAA